MAKKTSELIEKMDKAALMLLENLLSDKIIVADRESDVKAKIEVFNALVRWTAIKNKIDPEPEKESGLEQLVRELNGRSAACGTIGGEGNSAETPDSSPGAPTAGSGGNPP